MWHGLEPDKMPDNNHRSGQNGTEDFFIEPLFESLRLSHHNNLSPPYKISVCVQIEDSARGGGREGRKRIFFRSGFVKPPEGSFGRK